MADLLNMDYINSLPQPLFVRDGSWWPVHDIDVETGLVRIDACGMLDVTHISKLFVFRDACGNEHDADDFYTIAPAPNGAAANPASVMREKDGGAE